MIIALATNVFVLLNPVRSEQCFFGEKCITFWHWKSIFSHNLNGLIWGVSSGHFDVLRYLNTAQTTIQTRRHKISFFCIWSKSHGKQSKFHPKHHFYCLLMCTFLSKWKLLFSWQNPKWHHTLLKILNALWQKLRVQYSPT